MGDGRPERLRQRILEVPYGYPQRKRENVLSVVRAGPAVLQQDDEGPAERRSDSSSLSGPVVEDEIIDLEFIPPDSPMVKALALAGAGVIQEAMIQLDDWVESW